MKRNPFHVLGLPTGATREDIVERGQELAELASGDEERHRVLEAQRELITHPATRLRHELLEVPGTAYREREWAAFERRHRKGPVDLKALAASSEPLRREDFDLRAVLALRLDDLLRPPPEADLRPALENPPVRPTCGAPPIEVSDVLFG